jgi:hypothetical protein
MAPWIIPITIVVAIMLVSGYTGYILGASKTRQCTKCDGWAPHIHYKGDKWWS